MPSLDEIAEQIHRDFESRTKRRDELLANARQLTRHCAHAIRAVHRSEREVANTELEAARQLVEAMHAVELIFPDLYFAGYTQDALKEFAEANLVYAFVFSASDPLPTPAELGVESAAYLQGLAETVGELRRRVLDMLLKQNAEEASHLLVVMDDIYAVLVTMDYPDAITGGLRRLTDLARGIIERTRGDLTLSIRQEQLERNLKQLEQRLPDR
jgi:translin